MSALRDIQHTLSTEPGLGESLFRARFDSSMGTKTSNMAELSGGLFLLSDNCCRMITDDPPLTQRPRYCNICAVAGGYKVMYKEWSNYIVCDYFDCNICW